MIELLILILVWCFFVKRIDKKIKLKDENDRCVP